MSHLLSKHDLYELCVQSPDYLVPLLRAVHGGYPGVLGEDFCGSAALSREWVRKVAAGRAIAVDSDPEALGLARGPESLQVIEGDVVEATDPAAHAVDVLFVGNFSIGYWHTRSELVRYLGHARARLKAGGVFLCDTYGGESAFLLGSVHRDHPVGDGRIVRYTWEQREADPLTGMVTDVLHFQVMRAGVIEEEHPEAFVYHWRLWSVPELRDAMIEVGFESTEVHAQLPEALDGAGNAYVRPISDPGEIDDSFIVLVCGRAK